MRKRNVQIIASIVDYDPMDMPSINLSFDGCWLYVMDAKSISVFKELSNIYYPVDYNNMDVHGEDLADFLKMRITIPVNGKANFELVLGVNTVASDSLLSVFNEVCKRFEIIDYIALPDMFKFIHHFLPAYLEKKIVYSLPL